MADVAKSGTPSLASQLIPANCKHNLIAGEALAVMDACYIKSDGKAWKATGAAATAPAQVDGFAAVAASVGEAVTLIFDCTVNYGSGLTPGASYFLSGATAGALADAASTGGTGWVGKAVDATRVFLKKSSY